MSTNLPRVYDPAEVEKKIYRFWLDGGFFRAPTPGQGQGASPAGEARSTFTIVIPPPNVTGMLHMGHALNSTVQDVLTRWRRMQGYDTLWLPGTDHAGIATQNKVEEHIALDGFTRHDIGREKFLEKAWQWKEEYHNRILQQLYKLGVSCDWSRERFTLDEGCSDAVREVFVSLYKRGLIYRGDYMVNWCPRCHTAISDIEVEHQDKTSSITHIRYPGVGWEGSITVATTRPETMLGDTAVAVHPEDDRYRALVGKKVLLPLMNREIPIIADEYVDPAFGSGAVKITPAHDPNDFIIGQNHGLELINAIGGDGTMTAEMGKYAGMDRYDARRVIMEELQELSLIEKIEDLDHAVGHCQRCGTEIEPLVSLQWFVKMKPLAEAAVEKVQNGEISFVPERFTKVYLNWMENIRDWCISRQIWWGHRIPAWYCSCGEMIVAKEPPASCPACDADAATLQQDADVLDTWFSSALWPFSTLGWPEKTADLGHYFPTSVLVTAYDILTFWVARMIFMSLDFMQEIPFKDVCVHGLVRDAQGRKMSKSLGNGIDPLEVIDEYGADTLRFTLITGQAPGNDQRFRGESVEASRNFANKIWNASRFLLMNLEGDQHYSLPQKQELNRHDRWILDSFNETVQKTTALLEKYELGEAARVLYEFLWGDFCDWYIELSKLPLYGDNEAQKTGTKGVLSYVLERTLRLLHPFMPFISEEIWQKLSRETDSPTLMKAPWPVPEGALVDKEARSEMNLVMGVIRAIRNLRSEVGLPPGKKSLIILRIPGKLLPIFATEKDYIERLSWSEPVNIIIDTEEKPPCSLTALIEEVEIYLPLEGVVDLEQEIARLDKELRETIKELQKTEAKLSNDGFLQRAPAEVVQKEQSKKDEYSLLEAKLKARLAELKSL